MLSFVVDDVDTVYADAQRHGVLIVAGPRNLFCGQRQLLVTDPNEALVDVSAPAGMSEWFISGVVHDGITIREKQ